MELRLICVSQPDGTRIGMIPLVRLSVQAAMITNYLMDGEGMRLFARAACMENGIQLTVTSDLPGMQLYSGNYINNLQPGKDGAQYTRRSGFCMETQYPPNAVNCPDFCNPVLRKGVVYHHTTIYTFSPSSL